VQGDGLSPQQEAICDGFVYIPQYGPGTASLNVTVAASIVLHSFALWAGYQERAREGVKFVVAPRPERRGGRNRVAQVRRRASAGAGKRRWQGYMIADRVFERHPIIHPRSIQTQHIPQVVNACTWDTVRMQRHAALTLSSDCGSH
jgi:hypothetical protein